MSHHHDHGHGHGHHKGDHHQHGPQHPDHQEEHELRHHAEQEPSATSGAPSETGKMVKMVEHWIHHNEEHAKSYNTWAERARGMGLDQVALILDEVAGGTLAQNGSFDKILNLLKDELAVR